MRKRGGRPRKPVHELVSSGVGTSERLQHGDHITRDRYAILDDRGLFAHPFRNVDILERWSKGNPPRITPEMKDAGDRFRIMFRRANLDLLRAQMLFEPVDGKPTYQDFIAGDDNAYRYVKFVMAALGGTNSPGGSCVWYVLGEGYTIEEWCTKCGWSGRTMSNDHATGVLIAALGVMAQNRS